jgi:protein TonB
MLEDSLFESRGARRTRKPITLIVAAIAHAVVVAALVLIPLLETQALPLPPVNMPLWTPRPVNLEPLGVFVAKPRTPTRPQTEAVVLTAPSAIPDKIAVVSEPPDPNLVLLALAGSGNGHTSSSELLNSLALSNGPAAPGLAPPPPLLPPPPSFKAEPIRQGGIVQAANLIHQINPEYPTLARKTRVQGVVVMEAAISKDGSVESLRIVSGHPLLSQAALDAVRQWRYRPTMLNGEPVEVIHTITVTFTLQ